MSSDFDGDSWLQEALSTFREEQRRIAELEGRPTFASGAALSSMAVRLRREGMSPEAVVAALLEENQLRCDPPLPEDEVRRIAEDDADSFAVAQRALWDTDMGNAERLALRYGRDLRYCTDTGRWLRWNGACWDWTDTSLIHSLAFRASLVLAEEVAAAKAELKEKMAKYDELTRGPDGSVLMDPPLEARKLQEELPFLEQRIQNLAVHHKKSQQQKSLEACERASRSLEELRVQSSHLNKQDWFLAVRNGTIDLKTGAFLKPNRLHYSTQNSGVEYDPDAKCPEWENFLRTAQEGDEEVISYLQRAAGYTLTGSVQEQVLFFAHGDGATGKSTFVGVLQHILGEFSIAATVDFLTERKSNEHPTEIASMFGRRMVACTETEEGTRFSEARLKQFTGGDMLTARYMRQDYFTFRPTHKLWLAGNHKPRVRGVDGGVWRRMRVIPFENVIPEHKRDKHLPKRLIEKESAGILAWAVRGCLEWRKVGLNPPARVLEAVEEYREEEDYFQRFIDERIDRADGFSCKGSELLKAYKDWAEDNNVPRLRGSDIARRVQQKLGVDQQRTKDCNIWNGIRVRTLH